MGRRGQSRRRKCGRRGRTRRRSVRGSGGAFPPHSTVHLDKGIPPRLLLTPTPTPGVLEIWSFPLCGLGWEGWVDYIAPYSNPIVTTGRGVQGCLRESPHPHLLWGQIVPVKYAPSTWCMLGPPDVVAIVAATWCFGCQPPVPTALQGTTPGC